MSAYCVPGSPMRPSGKVRTASSRISILPNLVLSICIRFLPFLLEEVHEGRLENAGARSERRLVHGRLHGVVGHGLRHVRVLEVRLETVLGLLELLQAVERGVEPLA